MRNESVAFLPSTEESRSGFYPTPPALCEALLEGIEWDKIESVLEPSAGKGDLIWAVAKRLATYSRYNDNSRCVDVVEIDPHLRSILKYEFCGEKEDQLHDAKRDLENKRHYDYEKRREVGLTEREMQEFAQVEEDLRLLNRVDVHIVHDDFLTYDSRARYSLIVMNPPFANGDEHLIKAIQMQKRYGGELRCILNAETINNPYTARRQLLMTLLNELGAEITYQDNAFSQADRKTDVSVAIIKISIPQAKEESDIFERLRKAANMEEPDPSTIQDMTVADFMAQIISLYKVECDAGIELIRQYVNLIPYLATSFERDDDYHTYTNLTLFVGSESRHYSGSIPSINQYLRLVRSKYWHALFSNHEFMGKLTSNLQEKYQQKVSQLKDYDFTLFNIEQIRTEMNAELKQGIESTIVKLFDDLTQKYSWYPEIDGNVTHYYNGWASNKAHKINKKVIVPIYGVFSSYSWDKDTFRVYEAEKQISDIEKVFEYLDGNMSASVDLHGALDRACREGRTRNIQCKFFDVTLYKKGTMHIKFTNLELLDKFNIYCSRKKNWLPPNYGRKQYADMTPEEKAVIDGFHGDGVEGSGAMEYNAVIKKAAYFLSEPTREVPALAPGAM